MTPGQRLKKLREQKSLDQHELGVELGKKTSATITKWESDQCLPNGRDLKKLAQFFGVSVDYLLGLEHLLNPRKTRTRTEG